MKRLKTISKSTLIIITLLVLNIVVFSAISSGIKHTEEEVAEMSTSTESNTYFKSGVNVLNWSYTLLKYFRQ